jgi:hypothetical protein
MPATRVDVLQNILGVLVASSAMIWAYKGGPVRYGTIPMPIEGRVVVFVCGLLILLHCLKQLFL